MLAGPRPPRPHLRRRHPASSGRSLYIEDRSPGPNNEPRESLLALSSQTNTLQIGDTVEIARFPGHEGRRFVLREAVYRKIGPGAEPAAVALPEGRSVNTDFDGVLAGAEGVLLSAASIEGEIRFLIQDKDATVQGIMDSQALRPRQRRAFTPLPRRQQTRAHWHL